MGAAFRTWGRNYCKVEGGGIKVGPLRIRIGVRAGQHARWDLRWGGGGLARVVAVGHWARFFLPRRCFGHMLLAVITLRSREHFVI